MEFQAYECEGFYVRVLGDGVNARFVCDCPEYHTPTRFSPYNSCRHVIIVSSLVSRGIR